MLFNAAPPVARSKLGDESAVLMLSASVSSSIFRAPMISIHWYFLEQSHRKKKKLQKPIDNRALLPKEKYVVLENIKHYIQI
jgi:hypothetical protein